LPELFTENLAYEDVEDEHTITPKAPKSKTKAKTKPVEKETIKSSGKGRQGDSGRKR
jgi:hypothetical protein